MIPWWWVSLFWLRDVSWMKWNFVLCRGTPCQRSWWSSSSGQWMLDLNDVADVVSQNAQDEKKDVKHICFVGILGPCQSLSKAFFLPKPILWTYCWICGHSSPLCWSFLGICSKCGNEKQQQQTLWIISISMRWSCEAWQAYCPSRRRRRKEMKGMRIWSKKRPKHKTAARTEKNQ